MADKPTTLARDTRNSVLQIAGYDTTKSVNVSNGVTSAETYRAYVRIVNTGTTTAWINMNDAGADTVGMALLAGTEIHLIIPQGEYIGVFGDCNLSYLGE